MKEQFTRRQLIAYAASVAAGSFLITSCQSSLDENPKFIDYPFKLGVASGDPLPDGFVIWTRLVPVVYDTSSLQSKPIPVSWKIALDRKMKNIVRYGTHIALPENAHAVHVEISDLDADKEYFYQFQAGKERSPVGRTSTMPLFGSRVDNFRFAYGCCQDISGGYYAAYKDMVERDPRIMIHTGDYIYEKEWIGGLRRIPTEESFSLNDYRNLYTRYKLDPNLQMAHAQYPWLVMMDDHEIDDNWGGDYTEEKMNLSEFITRKIAAFKAFYEHMPLRLSAKINSGKSLFYQNTVIGDLIQFSLLDCRQYRDTPACIGGNGLAPQYIKDCTEVWGANRSMLGAKQETWLKRSLGSYGVRWNTIVQMSVMAPMDHLAGHDIGYKYDGWDGFPVTRQKILDWIKSKKISNPISIGGDIHAYYAGVIHEKAYDFESAPLMCEFVSTSISSGGGGGERYQKIIREENPSLYFFENRVRGYSLCDVSHKEWLVKLRKVENIMDPNSSCTTLKTFAVQNGMAEIVEV